VKILHVAPNVSRAYGGPTYSLAAYSRAALDCGLGITIAAPEPPEADRAWLAAMLPEATILSFPVFGRGAFLASPKLLSWLRTAGASFDVIHVHGLLNPVSSLATRTCVRKHWPVIVRPFGTLSRYTIAHRRSGLKRAYMKAIDLPNLRRVSAIHFTTTVEQRESEWHAIDWGVRAFVVPPPWIQDATHTELDTAVVSKSVVFISRLHPVKNVELLLDAWPAVLKRVSNGSLTIAGDGDASYVRSLKAKAAALTKSVRFVGHAEGVIKAQLLSSAAVFVLPSLHENFGIAVLEALAAGLPVVITAEVQLSAFVNEHSLGFVAERSASDLADAIVRALQDPVLRGHCRAKGAALVARYFSPLAIGEQLAEMYRFAAAHPPS
jgi:glycosyltransferase involved in cell wall biosynthesis